MSRNEDYPDFNYKDLLDAINNAGLPKFKPAKQKIYGSRNAIKRLKKQEKQRRIMKNEMPGMLWEIDCG